VADGMMFILGLDMNQLEKDFGGAKCPKFNLAGTEEVDNLTMAQTIAKIQNKPLKYKLEHANANRPGHDQRYCMSGAYLESLGWVPQIKLSERIEQVVNWTLENNRWLRR
jgi:dTDP-glucose 4,6-dehydratase